MEYVQVQKKICLQDSFGFWGIQVKSYLRLGLLILFYLSYFFFEYVDIKRVKMRDFKIIKQDFIFFLTRGKYIVNKEVFFIFKI